MSLFSISSSQEKALTTARQYFDYADKHPMTATFRRKAQEDYGFYDGTGQWPLHILQELMERGQTPVTVNKIKNLINYMSGVEIQTRFRVAFRSHSGKTEDDRLAKALTHLGYAIQENQDMPHKASLKFRDTLITGIGWSNIFKEKLNGEIFYEYINPLNILFDPDDLSPGLNNMNFVVRLRWLPLFQAEELWPKHTKYFKSLFSKSGNLDAGNYSGEIQQRQQGFIDLYAAGSGDTGSRLLVVEVQYKQKAKAYQGIDHQGHAFQTFNEEEAHQLTASKKGLEEVNATQIMRIVFTGEALLEYGPLEPMLPNLPDFTYIPCLWTRRFEDGVPEGWLSVMKDIQRESNYRRTKLVNNLNSFRAIIDSDAFVGKTPDEIRQELKRPDSVLVKTPGSILEIESNQGLAPGQFEMLQRGDQELQQVSGIFDDALGKQTNAESGVAIERRQVNSVRNQVFAFDNLRMMKKREARMMLDLIQGGGDEFIEAQILTDDEHEQILLNVVREVKGEKIIFNDIRTLPLSIYVEEVPDFESSLQEQQAALQALLGNANASLIMQSPLFMKRMGIRDYEALAQEMKQLSGEQAEQQAAIKTQAQGGMQASAPAQGMSAQQVGAIQ